MLKLLVILTIATIIVAALDTAAPRDDSDTAGARSGMTVYTDALTGCQYLGEIFALTPRMRADGTQVCHPTPKE